MSTLARPKGAKGKADRLLSQLVRSRGACESCGSTDYAMLQAAHIHSRRFNATRHDPLNLWALCATCHYRVDTHADEKLALAERTIGLDEYYRLKRVAEEGVKVSPAFWLEKVVYLQMLLNQQGDDAA